MGEYGARVGDQVQIWNNDDPNNPYYTGRTESWAQNQGLPAPKVASSPGSSFDTALWDALMRSNTMDLDWAKSSFGQSLEEQRRQFDLQQQMQGRSLYGSLAQSLLSSATSLRFPYDWLRYAQYTGGGKNIFNRLFGDQAASAFGAPTGYSEPATIDKILADLGLAGGQAQQQSATTSALQAATAPVTGGVPSATVKQSTPTAPASSEIQAPLPYQINPAVWDSLSPTAQQMIMASVERGNTPSGAWDPADYLRQLNASRPIGQAPRRVNFNFAQPSSYF